MSSSARSCGHCRTKDAKLLCGRCRNVYYCGPACQRAAWKSGGHKRSCRTPFLGDQPTSEGPSQQAALLNLATMSSMGATEFAALLRSAAKEDSLEDMYPLCMQACAIAESNPERAAQFAGGIMSFLERVPSAAIASYTCNVLLHIVDADITGVSLVLLRSVAALMRVLREYVRDPTVTHLIVTLLGAMVSGDVGEHAYQAVVDAGVAPLLADGARRHMSVEDPDIAASCFTTAASMCYGSASIKATLVHSGLADLAVRGILLRGNRAIVLTSSASNFLWQTMSVEGQRAKVLASGVTATVVAALPVLLGSPRGDMNLSTWSSFAYSTLSLPFELEEAPFGPIEVATAAFMTVLRVVSAAPHSEDAGPLVTLRILQIIGCTIMTKPEALAAFKRQGALLAVRTAAATHPDLRSIADKLEMLLSGS